MLDLSIRPVRRIVTGHDRDGRSVISFNGPAPGVHTFSDWPGAALIELWATAETPAAVDGDKDRSIRPVDMLPPAKGSVFRIGQLPPVSASGPGGADQFAELGGANLHTGGNGRSAAMHRTATIDYAVVLRGEVWLILDEEELLLQAGDCVVQRGTDHGWENRSDDICLIAFVLIDGLSSTALPPN